MAKPMYRITTTNGEAFLFDPTQNMANLEAVMLNGSQRGGLVGTFRPAPLPGESAVGTAKSMGIPWHRVELVEAVKIKAD